jgi:hypothetical protein
VKYVRPAASTMFKSIDRDLEKIVTGEKRIKESFHGST